MDLNTYKTLADVLGYALLIIPVAAFANQAINDRLKTREKQAIISAIPDGPDRTLNREISDIDAKSSRHSIINIILSALTLIFGLALLVSSSRIQEKDEKNIKELGVSQETANQNLINFEQRTNARVDLLSSRIRGNKQQILSLPKKEAFKTLESLGGKKICLVNVGSSNENSSFFNQIFESIHSYDTNLEVLTINHWETVSIGRGRPATTDNHNEIQVFDPEGQNGPFYKAIGESGLPTNLIENLPLSCDGSDYGLVIGGN